VLYTQHRVTAFSKGNQWDAHQKGLVGGKGGRKGKGGGKGKVGQGQKSNA
jgi:hypothetical protein